MVFSFVLVELIDYLPLPYSKICVGLTSFKEKLLDVLEFENVWDIGIDLLAVVVHEIKIKHLGLGYLFHLL